ncbi:MAG: 2,3-dimethylmalate lyase [Eubacterium aggregans]|uniref:2-methylisocitrate lyase n=1 Tax=Eubacterium aggregans TaxID=81409 RepID=A0A1H4DUV1_9FIRM|nr:2,3-dimethylmalate lyase [Eubacterium aggregans]MDD4692651.1 isocitrate lyase/PEP mutase family protein [Eubacterium aggregans]MEA5073526.1 2,3-dimethylmalate lyase [Eubacterium aggregans]SEA76269.1 carboxyvinyl-carboxyphosphonate phosphorylmutase [Eubacterium aggregans]
MNTAAKMRELLSTKKMVVAPGAHDAMTAKVIGRLGFDAVYMTGYGQSASHLGQPDVGLLTMTEMVARANAIVEAAGVPVIADADTGFGNAVNVMRTVREYEKAGVAVIQLEDQVMPKKCGHMVGREIVSKEEMVGKIKAAVDTRVNPDFMIMARTDARTTKGIEEALERGLAYKEAGADIIFIESPEGEEEMKRINETIPGYTLANMVEGGRTPLLKNAALEALGYNITIYPTASIYVATKAMVDLWTALKNDDTTAGVMDTMVTFSEFNDLMGLEKIREVEHNYATGR